MEVTKRLGAQYLWVNRLCINNSDLHEKNFIISKMDAIYEGAEFTIVSTAGDARTGIPGVTTTPRKPQPRVELKERSRTTGGAFTMNPVASASDPYLELFGVSKEECEETGKDREWLDLNPYFIKQISHPLTQFLPPLRNPDSIPYRNQTSQHLHITPSIALPSPFPFPSDIPY